MRTIFLISLFLIGSIQTSFAGGPWPQPKGKGYFKLSEWWTVFDQHYTDQGRIDPNVTTGLYNTTFYGEYGLSKRVTAIVNAPLLSRNYMNNLRSGTTNEVIVEGEAINAIGDIDLGFRYGLSKSGAAIPLALSLTLGLPTGKTNAGTQGNLQTGDGEFNQILLLEAGHSFQIGKVASYLSAYAGVNNRSNDFSEELRYGLEWGLGLAQQKLWLNAKLNVVSSFKNGATAETTTSTSLFANNAEFSSIALEASYYLTKRVGVSVSAAGAFSGSVIAAAPAYSVGVFYDLK